MAIVYTNTITRDACERERAREQSARDARKASTRAAYNPAPAHARSVRHAIEAKVGAALASVREMQRTRTRAQQARRDAIANELRGWRVYRHADSVATRIEAIEAQRDKLACDIETLRERAAHAPKRIRQLRNELNAIEPQSAHALARERLLAALAAIGQ